MKILTVVGARPQFIKAAVVSRALGRAGADERIVHTGQHYDAGMSGVFFDEMGIPEPAYDLGVGSASHGAQTGRAMERLETVFQTERPDWVLVYGDTNSTVAGALAAVKLHIPVAHVEAGMRSFNRKMPEEINRVVTDHVADLHLCATRSAVGHLAAEGVIQGVHWVGDVMLDSVRHFRERARGRRDRFVGGVRDGAYALVTCHRAENTDDPDRLRGSFEGLRAVAEHVPVFFPLHPRTRSAMERLELPLPEGVTSLEPLSYLEMLDVQAGATLVLTDSGGVQKEAFFLGVPCITLRDETEWKETLRDGWNRLAGASADRIAMAASAVLSSPPRGEPDLEPFGAGRAADRIAELLVGGPT